MVNIMKKDYKWRLEIEVDTNDADYIKESVNLTDEGLEHIKGCVETLKRRFPNLVGFAQSEYHGNWSDDILSDDPDYNDLETIANLAPYGEYGWHTLESIKYFPYAKEVRLV